MKDLVPILTEEDRLYAARLVTIAVRTTQVASLQREHETMLAGLRRFESLYRSRLATVQAEIDTLRADVTKYRERLERLRQRLQGREGAAGPDPFDDPDAELPPGAEFDPEDAGAIRQRRPSPPMSPELRDLYRQLAKRFHPDLARTPEERRRREDMMLRINEAQRTRNLAALQAIARETEREDALAGTGLAGDRLAWTALELARLEAVHGDIAAQIAALQASKTYRYWADGADVEASIAELEIEANGRAERLRTRLAELVQAHDKLKVRVEARERFRVNANRRLRAS
jgi:hypothetical protein